MKSPALFAVLAALLAVAPVAAAPAAADTWSYDALTSQADLVVIATPVTVKDLGESTILPGIQALGADGKAKPVAAIGMETTFNIEVVLKGTWPINHLLLYHLREAKQPAHPVPGGPLLVNFDPKNKVRYLMFLKTTRDGRFVALTGQTDPGLAIKDLGANP